MVEPASELIVDWRTLPSTDQEAFDFLNLESPSAGSSRQSQLPEPSLVLQQENSKQKADCHIVFLQHHGLTLAVKYGIKVKVEEAITAWALREYLPLIGGRRPIPTIYGWRKYDGMVFIYMEHIKGVTLEERWPQLSPESKSVICTQLGQVVSTIRNLKQTAGDSFLGSIPKGPIQDNRMFCEYGNSKIQGVPGPFPTLKEFYTYLDWIPKQMNRDYPIALRDVENFYLSQIFNKEDGKIVFTHGDLAKVNIMVSADEPATLLAVIDWELASWCPEYWEYFKACILCAGQEDWFEDCYRSRWLKEVYDEEFQWISIYAESIGYF